MLKNRKMLQKLKSYKSISIQLSDERLYKSMLFFKLMLLQRNVKFFSYNI